MPFLQTDHARGDRADNLLPGIDRHEDTHGFETLSKGVRRKHGLEEPPGGVALPKFLERFAQAG